MRLSGRRGKRTRASKILRRVRRGPNVPRRFPVTLERLEDRLVLANIFWTVDADGFWDVASNWRDELGVSRLPAAGDDVFLDRPAGTFTITHRGTSSTAVRSLHADRNGFVLSGGSLTITAASDLDGQFTLSGGSLISNAVFTTSGTSTWNGGTIQGSGTIRNIGQWNLTGDSLKSISGALENAGIIVHSGSGNLGLNIGGVDGTLHNLSGGLYDLQGDADFDQGVFNNAGTLRKSAGTDVSTSRFGHRFNNLGGTIDVRTGIVAIAGSTGVAPSHTGGTYMVTAGATLDVTSGGSTDRQIFTGNFTSSGEGLLRLNGGLVEAGPGGATFNFPDYEWTGGRIDGGSDGLTNAGVMTLVSSADKQLSRNLINAGTILHGSTSGDLTNINLGSVTNLVGAIYDFQVDKSVSIDTFINQGTLRKSAGAGTAFMAPRNFSNERGIIDVTSGTLQISSPFTTMVGGLSTGGVFTASAGAVLDLTGPGNTVRYSGTYTGSGAGTVRVRAGVLQAGPAGANFNFPPGLFQWTGGVIAGGSTGLTNTGSMTMAGPDAKSLSGLLNNLGTVTNSGTGDLLLGQFGVFFSGPDGRFENRPGGLYDLQGEARLANGVFNNAGTVRKSAGTGTAMLFNHRFNNVGGTIDVRSGTFLLQGTSGAPYPTHTGGTFNVAAGAFLDLTNLGGIQVFTGNYTGSGAGLVRITGVINTGSAITVGPGGANFDFPPGMFQWIEGVINGIDGPFTNRGIMTVDVNTTVSLNPYVRLRGTLRNEGTILHVDDGIVAIDGDSGLGNITNLAGGVYVFRSDGKIQWSGSGLSAAVRNFGTLRKASGAGTATIDTDLPFHNVGTVEVNAGRLFVKSPVAQVNGTTLSGGTWKVQAAGVLELEDHPRFTTNDATVVLDGPAARFLAVEHLLVERGQPDDHERPYSARPGGTYRTQL